MLLPPVTKVSALPCFAADTESKDLTADTYQDEEDVVDRGRNTNRSSLPRSGGNLDISLRVSLLSSKSLAVSDIRGC